MQLGHVSRPSRRAASRGMTGTRMGANRSSRCRIQGDARPGGEGHPGGTFGTYPRSTAILTVAKPFSWKHLERRTRPPIGHPPRLRPSRYRAARPTALPPNTPIFLLNQKGVSQLGLCCELGRNARRPSHGILLGRCGAAALLA